jgi:16S rRNA processing protein RimM
MKNDAYVIVGKFGAAYGIKGWIKIQSYTASPSSILDYKPWHLLNTNQSWS